VGGGVATYLFLAYKEEGVGWSIRSWMSRRLAPLALVLGATGACLLVNDLDRYDRGAPSDAGSAGDGSDTIEGAADASGDAGEGGVASADAADEPCPGHAGPTPVRVGTYCIDSTEVTNAHYQRFLDALDGAVPDQSAPCAFNVTLVPQAGWPPPAGADTLPVVSVDWCDAYAYCAWAGKRLCGEIGGPDVPLSALTDPARDQWYAACSHGGLLLFPYGNTYTPGDCNIGHDGVTAAPGALQPVATAPQCIGGFPGLFDMTGNAGEWQDACNANTGKTDTCECTGGGFDTPDTSGTDVTPLSCKSRPDCVRGTAYPDTSFRCCSR
jgi:formylglycine-generating enzyme required for sulfatase activity